MAQDRAAPRAVTSRRVLSIALPVMLSNATVPILGAVDTGVVGQLGEAAPIGAVGIGAIIISGLYWLFGFLRMGTSGLAAQAHGAGDMSEVAALLSRALLIALAAGLMFIALQAPLFWLTFHLSPASAEVEGMARDYLAIRIWGAPFAIAVYAFSGWLIAMERTWSLLVVQLSMNLLNMALDLWFVLGLGWGVEGVAIATLIAEVTGALAALWLCRDAFRGVAWRTKALVFDRVKLWRMAAVNTDILIRSALLEVAFIWFLFRASAFGDVELASTQILMQFMHITAYALDGFALAAESLVGQYFGARNRPGLRRSVALTFGWGLVSVVVMALAFALGGPLLIDVMSTAPEVRTEARVYLIWMVLAPLIGVAAWMFDGVFIGATRTRDMRNGMMISLPVFLAASAALAPLGLHGLWGAMMLFFAARGLTLAVRYPALERAVG